MRRFFRIRQVFRSATPPDFRCAHAGADAPQSDRVRQNPGGNTGEIGANRKYSGKTRIRPLVNDPHKLNLRTNLQTLSCM
ncbi:hypothetical protein GDO81_026824 [Engystomops pustulosus]|uniref:Uncharacterized protein n=1 Tax=Engystomops pustulosus TaxID=76066 RepID=A0AAV6YM04_ENGPU|nr:hypothetical protein GDO81_026824 [Engystomops pustulosus]